MDFDRVSSIYDREIVPIWGYPFSRLLLKYVPATLNGTVMEIGCSTGYVSLELAKRLQGKGRIVALSSSMDMTEIAFRKGEDVVREGKVFFQHHNLKSFRFADGVFDLICSNLGLHYLDELETTLLESVRLLKPGGRAFFTLPMRGSFEELLSHIATCTENLGEMELTRQVLMHQVRFPAPEEFLYVLRRAGYDHVSLHLQPFQMIFPDGLSLLSSPFFRHHFLLEWRSFLQNMSFDTLLSELGDLLDVYRQGQEIKLWVRAGCFECTKAPPSLY